MGSVRSIIKFSVFTERQKRPREIAVATKNERWLEFLFLFDETGCIILRQPMRSMKGASLPGIA